ncbi:MAG: hypothetical protein KAW12_00630 [Candidatus Aminicenantes bacterium]|nr:hypothetical protein [Candidatus Aminicenantes bacterium]
MTKNSIAGKKRPTGRSLRTDYDSAWKDVIEELFTYFIEFFFPGIYRDIDFSRKIEFLSQELRKIMPDGKVGKRLADVLAKVYLKDGSMKCICIFIHIEVQGQPQEDFMERMYIYNYRAFDKFKETGVGVVSAAVLTDEDVNFRPDEYRISYWGFDLRMKIPIVKIIDYKVNEQKRKELEHSNNPMTLIVRAQLKNFEAEKGDDSKKYDVKRELIRECYAGGFSRDAARTLLKFIDWLLRVPEELEEKLSEEIIKLEEEYKMPYVTSWERRAAEAGMEKGIEAGIERGIEKGIEKGINKGKKQGVDEEKIRTAKRMLNDGLAVETIAKYTGLTARKIEKLKTTQQTH